MNKENTMMSSVRSMEDNISTQSITLIVELNEGVSMNSNRMDKLNQTWERMIDWYRNQPGTVTLSLDSAADMDQATENLQATWHSKCTCWTKNA